jgi:hypothetical protein
MIAPHAICHSEVFLVMKAASFGIAPALAISLGTSVGVAEADRSAAAETCCCAVASR